ncbi:MAG: DUF177 domain-containing protein [Selenomonadaceae bacterium]|nr:DUF177 domain-containing protein [Selenomonadaceae bacterium]
MKINVFGLKAGEKVPFAFAVPAAPYNAFLADGEFKSEIKVTGEVTLAGDGYLVSGLIKCRKAFVCDRCLEPTEVEQTHPFAEKYRQDGVADDEDAVPFTGETIDLAEMVRDTLIAAQPIGNLCREDCLGLCPKCGQNLNQGSCSCVIEDIDPRLADLKQLLI